MPQLMIAGTLFHSNKGRYNWVLGVIQLHRWSSCRPMLKSQSHRCSVAQVNAPASGVHTAFGFSHSLCSTFFEFSKHSLPSFTYCWSKNLCSQDIYLWCERVKLKVLPKQPEEEIEHGLITSLCLKNYQITHFQKTWNTKLRNIPLIPMQYHVAFLQLFKWTDLKTHLWRMLALLFFIITTGS